MRGGGEEAALGEAPVCPPLLHICLSSSSSRALASPFFHSR